MIQNAFQMTRADGRTRIIWWSGRASRKHFGQWLLPTKSTLELGASGRPDGRQRDRTTHAHSTLLVEKKIELINDEGTIIIKKKDKMKCEMVMMIVMIVMMVRVINYNRGQKEQIENDVSVNTVLESKKGSPIESILEISTAWSSWFSLKTKKCLIETWTTERDNSFWLTWITFIIWNNEIVNFGKLLLWKLWEDVIVKRVNWALWQLTPPSYRIKSTGIKCMCLTVGLCVGVCGPIICHQHRSNSVGLFTLLQILKCT